MAGQLIRMIGGSCTPCITLSYGIVFVHSYNETRRHIGYEYICFMGVDRNLL